MKIAIITHYYNSNNYGGVLQAYALCRWLNSQGYNAEQICFDIDKSKSRFGTKQSVIYLQIEGNILQNLEIIFRTQKKSIILQL